MIRPNFVIVGWDLFLAEINKLTCDYSYIFFLYEYLLHRCCCGAFFLIDSYYKTYRASISNIETKALKYSERYLFTAIYCSISEMSQIAFVHL